MLAAIGAFALIATTGAVMVILAAPSGPKRLTLAAGGSPPPLTHIGPLQRAYVGPLQRIYVGLPLRVIEQPVRVVLHPPLPPPGAQIAPGDISDSGVDTRTVGFVLLTVGVAGIVLLTLFWLWVGRARRPRPAY